MDVELARQYEILRAIAEGQHKLQTSLGYTLLICKGMGQWMQDRVHQIRESTFSQPLKEEDASVLTVESSIVESIANILLKKTKEKK